MKVLLDACVSSRARTAIEDAGHEVVAAGEWPEDPGDVEILARAFAEERVLVTLDKDFGELAIVRRLPHFGIVRLVGFRSDQQGPTCAQVLAEHEASLRRSAIVTAEPGRVRIRERAD